MGVPLNHALKNVFNYKPSMLVYPPFMETPKSWMNHDIPNHEMNRSSYRSTCSDPIDNSNT